MWFRFRDNAFEAMHQLLLRDGSAFGKLGRTITNVCGTADARDDPLPQVTAQVQDQVADAIEMWLRTTPYLVVAQLTQTVRNSIEVLPSS